jgi:hypothetical protein
MFTQPLVCHRACCGVDDLTEKDKAVEKRIERLYKPLTPKMFSTRFRS